jgi:cyclopropane-fatty-acyl-phospholipid synthase
LSLSVLRNVFGDQFAREFSVRLWDGTEVTASDRKRFVLSVNVPVALRAACAPPLDLNPGRPFIHRIIDIEGDIEYAFASLERAVPRIPKWRIPLLAAKLAQLPREPPHTAQDVPAARREGNVHSQARDREAIGLHYDLPVTFYRTFLDRNLVYSCGYFRTEGDTLDDAQVAKIDHTLRKLRLSPGERLLDVGCGFGALVMRAAERFGAEATGITLSRTQCDEARWRVAEHGLEERVSIELRDYRDLDGRQFDKIVSIGMFEHVGRERLTTYFSTLFRALPSRAGCS